MPAGSSANAHDNYRLIQSTLEDLLLCSYFFVQIFFPFETYNYILEGLYEAASAIV